jgi:hypothetical protein
MIVSVMKRITRFLRKRWRRFLGRRKSKRWKIISLHLRRY